MLITVLKAKLHRATVTDANIHYEGSVTIDSNLLDESGIHRHEQVHVYNISNGQRFVTYAIEGKRGSGTVCINGAAARLVTPGDHVIIVAYGQIDEAQAGAHTPKILLLGPRNEIIPRSPSV